MSHEKHWKIYVVGNPSYLKTELRLSQGTNAATLITEALLKLDQRHCTTLQRSLQPQEKPQEVLISQAAFR